MYFTVLFAAIAALVAVYFWLETPSSSQLLINTSSQQTKKIAFAALFSSSYAMGLSFLGESTQIVILGCTVPLLLPLFCHSALALWLIGMRAHAFTPYLVLLQVWLPVELRLLPGPHLFNMVAMATLVLLAFKGILQHQPLYNLHRLQRRDLICALTGLISFAALAIPIGMCCDALHFQMATFDLLPTVQFLVIGYMCIALVEEIVFRACLQGLLQQHWKKPKWALVVTALIFGACHVQKNLLGTAASLPNLLRSPYFPNWTYAALAALAGIFYGAVWIVTGKATASAVTHALVNFIRRAFFGNGSF